MSASLLAVAALAGSAYAGFSSVTWDTSQSDSSSEHIAAISTVMQVPELPSQQGLLLWPGLYADNGYLVQTLLVNDAAYLQTYCGTDGTTNQWCTLSYVFNGGVPTGNDNTNGVLVNVGDNLIITYGFDQASGNSTQKTVLQSTGEVLTSLTFGAGEGYRFADSIECHQPIDSIPQQQYFNTTITLANADPTFNSSLNANGASPGGFGSADGGLTWFIDTITLSPTSCQCNPTGGC